MVEEKVRALLCALFESFPTGPGPDGNRSWHVQVGPPIYNPADFKVYRAVEVTTDGVKHEDRFEVTPHPPFFTAAAP